MMQQMFIGTLHCNPRCSRTSESKLGGAAVGNDVEEPQELAVEPPAGGDDAG